MMSRISFIFLFVLVNTGVDGRSISKDLTSDLNALKDEFTEMLETLDELREKPLVNDIDGKEEGKDIFQIIEDTNDHYNNSLEVDGQFEDGKPLHRVESDIIETKKVKKIIEGTDTDDDEMSDVIKTDDERWERGIIPYHFAPGTYQATKKAVKDAIDDFERNSCIRGKELTDAEATNAGDYIEIIRGHGCYSHVGRKRGKQTLSLGIGCGTKGIAIHEFMHALGFWHEHSRFDRDYYVTIYPENMESGVLYQFVKHDTGDKRNLGIPYDLQSITHYGEKAFSKNGLSTIQAKYGYKIGQRKGLSERDIEHLKILYCQKDTWKKIPVRCEDKNKHCAHWASIGECTKNAWMGPNCCASCTKGKTTTTAPPTECVDADVMCGYWEINGECASYKDICCESCKNT